MMMMQLEVVAVWMRWRKVCVGWCRIWRYHIDTCSADWRCHCTLKVGVAVRRIRTGVHIIIIGIIWWCHGVAHHAHVLVVPWWRDMNLVLLFPLLHLHLNHAHALFGNCVLLLAQMLNVRKNIRCAFSKALTRLFTSFLVSNFKPNVIGGLDRPRTTFRFIFTCQESSWRI